MRMCSMVYAFFCQNTKNRNIRFYLWLLMSRTFCHSFIILCVLKIFRHVAISSSFSITRICANFLCVIYASDQRVKMCEYFVMNINEAHGWRIVDLSFSLCFANFRTMSSSLYVILAENENSD